MTPEERAEKIVSNLMRHNGWKSSDLYQELFIKIVAQIREAVGEEKVNGAYAEMERDRIARAEERERCAKIAEDFENCVCTDDVNCDGYIQIAQAIREQK